MITVKLVELGSPIQEIALEESACVRDLFNAAQKTFVQGNVTRNNIEIHEGMTLYNGDRIFLGKATKGNLDPFEVNFVRLGDTSIALPAEDGYTIKRTLEQLSSVERGKFYRADGTAAYEFRVGGGQPVGDDHVLERPAQGSQIRVICAQRVKGN